jgi:putative heme-binding domain-containing protein
VGCLVCFWLNASLLAKAQGPTQIGVTVPAGFLIEKVAANEVATNIFCMARDSDGQVYVSGPGYVARLIDDDGDGKFERAQSFADSPSSGAQGMWFGKDSDGHTTMLCTGDGGIWRYVDVDGDGEADGKPAKILNVKTGGEHDAHAIRRGHDGWFYLLAGNGTTILPEYFAGKYSPVKVPRAGFLMRMSPDFKTKEIVAHGFRNAYDFDINAAGEIFVYDSDGERDISLPWYRPTRVYKIRPGDDAGWVSAGWKRPSFYFDMPIEVGALGRGSPTGVECLQLSEVAEHPDDAVFVADWTFGRVVVFRRSAENGKLDRGSDFAIADGQFGFAVTDLVAADDGSMLCSVGGRGTTGSVFRISKQQISKRNSEPARTIEDSKQLGSPSPHPRTFSPFNKRTQWTREEAQTIFEAVQGGSGQLFKTVALESLVGRVDELSANEELCDQLVATISNCLAEPVSDSENFILIHRILNECNAEILGRIEATGLSKFLLELAAASSDADRSDLLSQLADEALANPSHWLELARVGQLVFDGCGAKDCPEMFKGYTPRNPIQLTSSWKHNYSAVIAKAAADKNSRAAMEFGRLAAMIGISSTELTDVMAGQLNESSNPIEDIHWLNCLAQVLSSDVSEEATKRITDGLLNIDKKFAARDLKTDRNWIPRMRQLARRLLQKAPSLASKVQQLIAGRDGQVFLFDELPKPLKTVAAAKFADAVSNDLANVTPDQLRVVAHLRPKESFGLIRRAATFSHLSDTATLALTLKPQSEDRSLFVSGLSSWNATIVKNCAIALRRLPASSGQSIANDAVLVFKAVSKLGTSKQDVSVRDQLVLLLRHLSKQQFGYQQKKNGESQAGSIGKWRDYLVHAFPAEFETLFPKNIRADLSKSLGAVKWSHGNLERGKKLYRELKCAQCHDGGSRLGPRLEGVARRFSKEDLFKAIVNPEDQIAERYRATIVQTLDGQLFTGVKIYESVDGITLQDASGATIRINQDDIDEKAISTKSIMPKGLLDEVPLEQWADLYAYIKTL